MFSRDNGKFCSCSRCIQRTFLSSSVGELLLLFFYSLFYELMFISMNTTFKIQMDLGCIAHWIVGMCLESHVIQNDWNTKNFESDVQEERKVLFWHKTEFVNTDFALFHINMGKTASKWLIKQWIGLELDVWKQGRKTLTNHIDLTVIDEH